MATLSATSSSPSRTPSRSEISRRSPASVQESRSPILKDSAGSIDDDLVLQTLATLQVQTPKGMFRDSLGET